MLASHAEEPTRVGDLVGARVGDRRGDAIGVQVLKRLLGQVRADRPLHQGHDVPVRMTNVVCGDPCALLAVLLDDEVDERLVDGGELFHGSEIFVQDVLRGAQGHEIAVEQQPASGALGPDEHLGLVRLPQQPQCLQDAALA